MAAKSWPNLRATIPVTTSSALSRCGAVTPTAPTPAIMDIQKQITHILREIGEDPEREGLLSTPKRVEKSYAYLMRGYNQNLKDVVNGAVFTSDADEMVIVRDIEFFSMCEHHMLPFFGHAHVGYIPKGKIIGVSKIARIVDMFARRLQVQERLTGQVAEALMEVLAPEGVGVVMEARHMCMQMRGVEKQNSVMTTSSMLGSFRDEAETRMEFLQLIRGA